MKLSIIIVSWNVRELLRKNLKSIFASDHDFDLEVFVVDNHSHDGTPEMIIKEFPQVNLIMNNYNAGFARANNQAIEQAQGDYFLLLNPDMLVFQDTFSKMVSWMDGHFDVGLAGCRLVDEDGKIVPHVRHFPGFWDQLAIILKLPHVFPGIVKNYLQKDFDYDREAEVDSIRGAFFMIRKELVQELGGLDERYFLWFEEVDYCRQVKNTKWKLMYTPSVKCIDHVGKSFGQVPRGTTQIYFRDSMLKYFRKWHSYPEYLMLKFFWFFGVLISKIKK